MCTITIIITIAITINTIYIYVCICMYVCMYGIIVYCSYNVYIIYIILNEMA